MHVVSKCQTHICDSLRLGLVGEVLCLFLFSCFLVGCYGWWVLYLGESRAQTLGTPFGESPQEKIGTIQRRLAWPLRKDDTHKSRMYHFFFLSLCLVLPLTYSFLTLPSLAQIENVSLFFPLSVSLVLPLGYSFLTLPSLSLRVGPRSRSPVGALPLLISGLLFRPSWDLSHNPFFFLGQPVKMEMCPEYRRRVQG